MPRATGSAAASAGERFERLVTSLLDTPGVGDRGRGWGATSLKVDGRMFAMLSKRGTIVVKLPRLGGGPRRLW
jgi:hypothetical protein